MAKSKAHKLRQAAAQQRQGAPAQEKTQNPFEIK